jgi:hypothetical protein
MANYSHVVAGIQVKDSNAPNFRKKWFIIRLILKKNIFMKNECLRLYNEMLNDTGLSGPRQSDIPGWTEHCFRVSVLAGLRLQKIIDSHSFIDEQEKHWISKTLKPHFNGWVEYFTLVYTAGLFVPEEHSKKMLYWTRELGKTWNFLMIHEEFYLSYRGKLIQEIPDDGNVLSGNINLAAAVMAKKRYMEYVQDKLAELRGRLQNSLLVRA